MISVSDTDYLETKAIKLGEKKLSDIFAALNLWLEENYDVKTINIYFDKIMPIHQPRLELIFETREEEIKFRTADGFNYKRSDQKKIAKAFGELVEKFKLQDKFETKNLLVIFSSFSGLAKLEPTIKIKNEELKELTEQYKSKDIWEIRQSAGGGLIIFFHEQDQIKANEKKEFIDQLKKGYFKLAKKYDDLNYLKTEDIQIYYDSKENFEKNYQSNWQYYYRDN